MDKLWAPWRERYVTKDIKENKGDLFERIYCDRKNDKKNLVLIRTQHSFSVFNIYPYNNGHMLVVPNRKVDDISKLSKEERNDLLDLVDLTKSLLEEVIHPDGFNIGINIGKAAGAGIPQHIHIHIVPRWKGDVNFMPVISNTKVISQSMKVLHKQLSDAYKRRNRKNRK